MFLAVGCVGFIASSPAMAQTAEQEGVLGGVTVTDTAIAEDTPKVEEAESPKFTRPLLDTPQTITVISNRTLQQQNLLTLREVLSTVPGITFAAGEGGFGYGDRITLRGYTANNDISVDGVRSGAVMNRNETYNIEQVEVTNGANGVFSGGGSVGGTINLVTKKPLDENQSVINAGIGTDNYYRGTVDINRLVGDGVAVRLNAVYHENEVPGRQVEYFQRWGVAPAITFGIDGPTSVTLQYEHLDDEGMPQYGLRYYPDLGGFIEPFNTEGYYGFANVDTQRAKTNSGQAIIAHEFSDSLRIRNLTRVEDIAQYTVTSQPNGTFCLANGLQPTGAACTAAIRTVATPAGSPLNTLTIPAGYYLPTGGRGNTRYINNRTAYNQLDLSGEFDTGGIEHTAVLGGSILWEKYSQLSGNLLRTAQGFDPYAAPFTGTGATGTPNPLYNAAASLGFYYPLVSIADPSGGAAGPAAAAGALPRVYGTNEYVGPRNFIRGSRADGKQSSYAVYLFDTMKFSDAFELNGGVRYEKFEGENSSITYSTAPGATLGNVTAAGTPFRSEDSLFSYRIGAVFKPSENSSIYAAFGNSETPSKASVDGACAANNCNVEPESAKNYEIGAKIDLFGDALQLSAAIFRNERDKYRVASGDPTVPDQVLDGHSRVDGIALGAVGNITSEWSISANYTYLDSELIQSVSDFCLANPGFTPPAVPGQPAPTPTCSNTAADPDPAAGTLLPATPKHSGSLFTSYRFPFGLEAGYGFTYQGRHALNPTATGTTPVYFVPDYLTHRFMLNYMFNDALSAQLNIQNFTNERYATTVRTAVGGSWAQPGVDRQAVLTIGYRF